MVAICFYFQVHQPFRLNRSFDFFSIGSGERYEDDHKNREIMNKVAEKCYLPTNQLLLELIKKYHGKFRISYSISGTALDQFELYRPDVLDSFKQLADTGCVEFLCETYYHSLSFLFSEAEFKRQVKLHKAKIKKLFGQTPKTFRNTELIYNNRLASVIEELGFQTILAEGVDRILQWRSPNFVYKPLACEKLNLLLKNYKLSDDIAFRFSQQSWSEWPLTADKFSYWAHQVAGGGETINLFMDYETFGEHQWASTGIFEFLRHLPETIWRHPDYEFLTPSQVSKKFTPKAELDIHHPISWADMERDVSAWLGNSLQDSAIEFVYAMEKDVLATKDDTLIHAWRKLQTSDHFYYMCIKWFNDGDVHKYFNPYDSPYDAFIYFTNAVNQLRWATKNALEAKKELEKLKKLEKQRKAAAHKILPPEKHDKPKPAKKIAAPAAKSKSVSRMA